MASTGELWVKANNDPAHSWTKVTNASVDAGASMRPVQRIYYKTGVSTWTIRYERDTTPPPQPVALTASMSGSTLVLNATAPAAPDMDHLVLRFSTTAYPTSITDGRGGRVQAEGSGGIWISTWPDQTGGTKYYWALFAVDTSGNVSTPKLLTYTIPKIATVTPPVSKSGYFLPTDSGSWNDIDDYWRTDNNYVYQGGFFWHGMWFYSTRITSALARAKTITKMTIQVTRVNSVHGIVGEAQVYLTAHSLAIQPAGNPNTFDTTGTLVGGLNRGETKTFTVPSKYYAGFLSKSYKGFGLFIGETSFTSPNYLYAVGAGSSVSGRVFIQWTE